VPPHSYRRAIRHPSHVQPYPVRSGWGLIQRKHSLHVLILLAIRDQLSRGQLSRICCGVSMCAAPPPSPAKISGAQPNTLFQHSLLGYARFRFSERVTVNEPKVGKRLLVSCHASELFCGAFRADRACHAQYGSPLGRSYRLSTDVRQG